MTAQILDGKSLAKTLRAQIATEVAAFIAEHSVKPTLAAMLVGDDPASQVYVRNKERACEKAGIGSQLIRLASDISQAELLAEIEKLNNDNEVHGILVQLPLPSHLDERAVLDAVNPAKDVDCFHPTNVGLLSQGRPRFIPCTPQGIMQLLLSSEIKVSGMHAVVLGRSDIVGKPMAMLLQQRDASFGPDVANATVTLCHSRTRDLLEHTLKADLLIAAVGQPNFVTTDMVKPGAIVIDVGINRTDDGLVGDVHFESVSEVASQITPVPGGVGPLTIAMVLRNTLTAAELQTR